jgi:hypothetical protein
MIYKSPFMFKFLFLFLTKICLVLVPLIIIAFSIAFSLSDSTNHKNTLRNDNFYQNIVAKSDSFASLIDNKFFIQLQSGLSKKEDVLLNSTNSIKFQNALEANLRSTTELALDNTAKAITTKNNVKPSINDLPGLVLYYSSLIWEYNIVILASIGLALLLIFVLSIARGGNFFTDNARFYLNLFWSLVGTLITTFLIFGGFGLVSSYFGDFFVKQYGIKALDLEVMQVIKNQFLKFIFSLLTPALYTAIACLIMAIIMSFLSIFIKEGGKEQREFDKKLNYNSKKNHKEPVEEFLPDLVTNEQNSSKRTLETNNEMPNSEPITQYSQEAKPSTETTTKLTIAKNDHSIDPFLEHLSKEIDRVNNI